MKTVKVVKKNGLKIEARQEFYCGNIHFSLEIVGDRNRTTYSGLIDIGSGYANLCKTSSSRTDSTKSDGFSRSYESNFYENKESKERMLFLVNRLVNKYL